MLANDPDADRCAVAVPGPRGWRMLRGDEVGALLGDHLLRSGLEGVYASSIVSSSLLAELAAAYGRPHQETLTGFKWIGRVEGLAFGYEEALGYCVAPGLVRDKDGVSALLLVAELAARLKAEGRTLDDRLDEIAREHGLFATDQLSVRVSDRPGDQRRHGAAAGAPADRAGRAGGRAGRGPRRRHAPGCRRPRACATAWPSASRVVVRPSGTEPKIKAYLEVVVPVEADEPGGVDAARIVAVQRLDAIRQDLATAAGL